MRSIVDERADEDLSRVDWYGEELRGVRFVRCTFFDATLDA